MTIVEFLNARLNEEERAAKAATPGPWRHNPDKHWHRPGSVEFEESVFAGAAGDAATSVAGTGPSDDPQSMADAAHIALHDPARVLREVEAKRAILRWLDHMESKAQDANLWDVDVNEARRALALAYSDHADYAAIE